MTRRTTKPNASPKDVARPPAADAARITKLDQIIALLRQDGGAALAEMMTATGWQAHSVRGALAAGVKKKTGSAVVSEKLERVRRYRFAGADEAKGE
jgi:hypothetical protein